MKHTAICLLLVLFVSACSHRTASTVTTGSTAVAATAAQIAIQTDKGFRVLRGDEATQQQAHEAWIFERLKEAKSIKVGTTYAELSKYFKQDGGLTFGDQHRFDLILCSCIKIDVGFTDKDGKKLLFKWARYRTTRVSAAFPNPTWRSHFSIDVPDA
jgi:hypothetical protein